MRNLIGWMAVGLAAVGVAGVWGQDAAGPGDGPAVAATTTAPAAAPAGAATQPAQAVATTQALLAELASDDWRVRQRAVNELVKRGAGAKGEIERVLAEATDPSAQADLRAALRQIEENERFGPTLVTARLSEVKPREAFEELGRQAGVRFVAVPENMWEMRQGGRAITTEWDGVPFWKAMAELCERAGMYPNPHTGGGEVGAFTLYAGGSNLFGGPMCVSGPCAVIASSVTRNQSVSFARAGGGRTADLRVQMMLWVEPKVRAVRVNGPVRVTEAVDELGNSLRKPNDTSGGGWSSGRGAYNITVGLTDIPTIGKRLAVLKGSASILVVATAETLEATTAGGGVGAGSARNVNGVRVEVKEFKEEGEFCVAKINCETANDPRQQQNLDRLWEAAQAGGMRMLDAEGRGLQLNSVNPTSRGVGTMEITGRFMKRVNNGSAQATSPIKMVWEIPVTTREMPVPFEFKDLPLP